MRSFMRREVEPSRIPTASSANDADQIRGGHDGRNHLQRRSRRMQLLAQVRTVVTACRDMLDASVSSRMQHGVAEAGNVRPRQPRSTPPEVAAEQSNSSTKRFDLPAPDVLVRRLGVSDFGVAQLIHDGDVPRAHCAPVSARFAGGGCSIPSRKRTHQFTRSDVPGPSDIPTMYPERPVGHGRVRTAPGRNVSRDALCCEGYGAFADARGRKRTAANGALVPRGGIEPPTLRFSVACSTN
jgi:hypothetical protein